MHIAQMHIFPMRWMKQFSQSPGGLLMADHLLDEQATPTAPSAGQVLSYPDNQSHRMCHYPGSGTARAWGYDRNWSTANLAPSAATDTYITGSNLLIPSSGLQVGSRFIWYISASKTAASTAAAVFTVRMGTLLTTSDTSELVLTMGVQTAAVDTGIFVIMVTVRSIGAAGVIQGTVTIAHSAATSTGFGNPVEATSSGFDMTSSSGKSIGLSLNTGTAGAWTITQVQSEIQY